MEATVKLYESNPYSTDFVAQVLSCSKQGNQYTVVLDQTMFYPEGGGQPCDKGMLDGTQVLQVREKDGVIEHIVGQEITVGESVVGSVNWEYRYDLMQQHTGEHLFSGIAHTLFGVDNVGFHMSADVITLDLNGILSETALQQIERQANQAIWANVPVNCYYPTKEQLELLHYRSKKEIEGPLRLVEIPGFDLCACCGTHVARTGELGLIKMCNFERFRGGVRVQIVSGRRAYDYVCMTTAQNHAVGVALSVKACDTGDAVQRLIEENNANKARVATLEEKAFADLASQYAEARDPLVFAEGLTPDGLRRLTNALLKVCGGHCAVFTGTDQTGYQYAIWEVNGNLSALGEALNSALDGRGGGKPDFIQGSVRAQHADIVDFFAQYEG